MHPLVHTWGRDWLTSNGKKDCCLISYVILTCSLRWDGGQPHEFLRTLVTHVRANLEDSKSGGSRDIFSYMRGSCEKFWKLFLEQGYFTEVENLGSKVLDEREGILGVENPDTINAIGSLASTYYKLGKYSEAEKLEMQVLVARNRILGVEHLDIIDAKHIKT